MKIIVLGGDETLPSSHEDAVFAACKAQLVVTEATPVVTEVAACSAGRARERHLYTSSANQMTIYMSRGGGGGGFPKDVADDHVGPTEDAFPRFILSYEGRSRSRSMSRSSST